MSEGTKIPWTTAHPLAAKLAAAMAPACERIEVAGSVRRRKMYVGDIEIVCVPRMEAGGLFGDAPVNLLLPVLSRLCADRVLSPIKGGDKFRQYDIIESSCTKLDVFMVELSQWGVKLAIYTGPQEFSKAIVTQKCWGGLLANGLKVEDGRVWPLDGGKPLDTPEEANFLALAGGWVEPERRAAAVGVTA